ncbi:MAG: hypothetical protein WB443_14240, partial [Nitrososphaeraceae archaeon]
DEVIEGIEKDSNKFAMISLSGFGMSNSINKKISKQKEIAVLIILLDYRQKNKWKSRFMIIKRYYTILH